MHLTSEKEQFVIDLVLKEVFCYYVDMSVTHQLMVINGSEVSFYFLDKCIQYCCLYLYFCEISLCVMCFVCVFRYESVIATLCENLDSLDEPEARAAMIWIVGEYAERIDNADELLESFLEGFHDESTQVCLDVVLFCLFYQVFIPLYSDGFDQSAKNFRTYLFL